MATFIVGLILFISLGMITLCTFMALKSADNEREDWKKTMKDLEQASNEYFQILRDFNASMGDLHL